VPTRTRNPAKPIDRATIIHTCIRSVGNALDPSVAVPRGWLARITNRRRNDVTVTSLRTPIPTCRARFRHFRFPCDKRRLVGSTCSIGVSYWCTVFFSATGMKQTDRRTDGSQHRLSAMAEGIVTSKLTVNASQRLSKHFRHATMFLVV